MTKEIPLTQGKFAIVDDDVYEWASKHKWQASRDVNTYYARRSEKTVNGRKTIRLHREILQAPQELQVDHIDGDGLNCLRSNLRLAKVAENQYNSKLRSDNTSGYKGVRWSKVVGKWQATICCEGKEIHLGSYTTPEEAARAYDAAARKHHGEFARTNEGENRV